MSTTSTNLLESSFTSGQRISGIISHILMSRERRSNSITTAKKNGLNLMIPRFYRLALKSSRLSVLVTRRVRGVPRMEDGVVGAEEAETAVRTHIYWYMRESWRINWYWLLMMKMKRRGIWRRKEFLIRYKKKKNRKRKSGRKRRGMRGRRKRRRGIYF